jgi:hypothetical protein
MIYVAIYQPPTIQREKDQRNIQHAHAKRCFLGIAFDKKPPSRTHQIKIPLLYRLNELSRKYGSAGHAAGGFYFSETGGVLPSSGEGADRVDGALDQVHHLPNASEVDGLVSPSR